MRDANHLQTALIALVFATNTLQLASADCTQAYEQASKRRNIRNIFLASGGLVAAGGGVLHFVGSEWISDTLANENIDKLPSIDQVDPSEIKKVRSYYKNNYEKVVGAVRASVEPHSEKDQKHLDKILKKVSKKLDSTLTDEQTKKAKVLLVEGFFVNDDFCPLKKEGSEKRTALNITKIVSYLADHLSDSKMNRDLNPGALSKQTSE